MILRSLVPTAALAVALAGPAAAFTLVPPADTALPLILAQTQDAEARLEAAQEAFDKATQHLQETLQSGGDVEAARQLLEAAQEELRAAQQAAAEQPPAEEELSEPVEPPLETQEAEPAEPPVDLQQTQPVEPPLDLQQTEPAEPPVETQEAEPAEPQIETQEAEPAEPPVDLQQTQPAEPPLDLQQTQPAEPPLDLKQTQPAEPPLDLQQTQPAEPPVETQEAEPAEPPSLFDRLRGQVTPDEPPTLEQQAEPDRGRRQRDGGPDGERGFELQEAEPRERGGRGRDRPRRAEDLPDRVHGDAEIVRREGDRIIIQQGDQIFIRKDENDRIRRFGREVETERLRGGLTRTVVTRPNGVQVITVRDEYGEIVRRVRRLPSGREIVLFDVREPERPVRLDWERRLPPLVVQIPREEYIVEMDRASEEDIREALIAPPVEEVERVYTLQEVRQSERLRDKVRRVDLDTITFEFNSAAIARDQIPALASIGEALEDIMADNPQEVYLIEGHTDAVGSDLYNLELSDRRAESVAIVLSENFDIPPENLITQGYGEQYLKVPTQEQERENRRVTIRRITPLISSAQ